MMRVIILRGRHFPIVALCECGKCMFEVLVNKNRNHCAHKVRQQCTCLKRLWKNCGQEQQNVFKIWEGPDGKRYRTCKAAIAAGYSPWVQRLEWHAWQIMGDIAMWIWKFLERTSRMSATKQKYAWMCVKNPLSIWKTDCKMFEIQPCIWNRVIIVRGRHGS